MTVAGWAQLVLFVAVLTALTAPLGGYLVRVFSAEPRRAERTVLGLLGADPYEEQEWPAYARALLVFSAASLVLTYVVLRTQDLHPFNPSGFPAPPWDVSFNTAISFVSNTSWQFYAGETTLSAFSQMAGIAAASFLSAAVGLASAMAVIRGFVARGRTTIGNFWLDLVRALVYVVVPLAAIGALAQLAGGVVQSLDGPVTAGGLAGGTQDITVGPVATWAAIKTLGSVGGGYFNVNSAMPFENASAWSSFVQMLLIILVPAGLTSAFGRMAGNRRQGWALYGVMAVLLVAAFGVLYAAEGHGTPAMHAAGIHGVNMEGKEQRFGAAGTALYATVTTDGASGAVNGAMESLSGLGGLVPLANMVTGEVVFGGIGTGLSSMLLVVLMGVFLAGLMVGRTPQFLGKKIEGREMKLVLIGTIAPLMVVLLLAAVASVSDYGTVSIYDSGRRGSPRPSTRTPPRR